MDKIDNISIGQFYTSDKVKDSGLINSPSFNKIYSAKYRADKNAQDVDVINNGIDDTSDVFEIIDTSSAGGSSNLPADVCRIGWANYINGDTTPITLPAGVPTKLTLTTTGGSEEETYLPLGVSGLWDSTNSQFDFSTLEVGDMIDIRLDGSLTTTTLNDSFEVSLMAGVGSPSEFSLPFASGNRFVAGTSIISRYNSLFIGSEDVKNNPAEFLGTATDDATGFLVDIYVKVLKRVG